MPLPLPGPAPAPGPFGAAPETRDTLARAPPFPAARRLQPPSAGCRPLLRSARRDWPASLSLIRPRCLRKCGHAAVGVGLCLSWRAGEAEVVAAGSSPALAPSPRLTRRSQIERLCGGLIVCACPRCIPEKSLGGLVGYGTSAAGLAGAAAGVRRSPPQQLPQQPWEHTRWVCEGCLS